MGCTYAGMFEYELITTGSNANTYRVTKGTVMVDGALVIPATYNGRPVTEIGIIPSGSYSFSSNDGAFNSTSITSVSIPDSVTTIGLYAFYYCTSLTSITIGSGVTTISDSAFMYCANLTNITVNASNSNYTGESGILYDKTKTTLIAYPSASSSITIPAGVTSIGSNAFYGCTNLTSVNITAIVTSIDSQAFYGCSSLTSITVNESNTNYASEGGILYNKAKTR